MMFFSYEQIGFGEGGMHAKAFEQDVQEIMGALGQRGEL